MTFLITEFYRWNKEQPEENATQQVNIVNKSPNDQMTNKAC